ncbi:MAG: type II secretion system F family protein [Actinomycetota bacterium]
MELPLVLGSIAVALSFLVVWWSVAGRRTDHPVDLNVQGTPFAATDSVDLRTRILRPNATDRAVPLLERLGSRVRSIMPAERTAALARKIRSAGSPDGWTVERLLVAKLLGTIVLTLLFLFRFIGSPSALNLLLLVLAALFGFLLPDGLLDSKVTSRKNAVRADVAEVIDQLAVMVRAGISVDAAIARCAQQNQGSLGEELRRVVQDMRVGVSRTRALLNMSERVDVAELRGFVTALSQAEKLGVPVSETLRVQAGEMRLKQRQSAQETAMKLPVKILFPMVVCILPVIFIVLLGPAAIKIFEQFSK